MIVRHSIITLLIYAGAACGSLADSFQLEGINGESYHLPYADSEIDWKATNDLPKGLWIYKVIPQEFSQSAITNLMSLCGFQWGNMTKYQDDFIPDKNLFRFTDKKQNWNKYLIVAPTIGWIEYYTNSTSSTNGVPSESKAEKLALNVLFQMGIDRSLLCNMHEHITTQGKLSRNGEKLSTNVVSRGVSYSRLVDGIPSRNSAIFTIDFGGNAQVTHFRLSWRNLLPYEAHPTLEPKQIIDLIKSGQTKISIFEENPNLNEVKKISVTSVSPIYFESSGMKPLAFVYPYANLELIADMGGTNSVKFHLQCPIISTNQFR